MRRTDERKLWWLIMATMLFALTAHADLVSEWNVTAMEVSAQTRS